MNNTPKRYVLTVKHDNGKIKIHTISDSRESAIKSVCIAEKCPESAIVKIREYKI